MENQSSSQTAIPPQLTSPSETSYATQEKRPKKWLIIFLLLLFLAILGVAGYSTYQNYQQKQQAIFKQSISTPARKSSPPSASSSTSQRVPQEELTLEQAQSQYVDFSISISGAGGMIVGPGIRDQIPITVSNTGSKPVTIEFKIIGDTGTWFDTQQVPKLKELNPNQQFIFQVQFKTPSNVKTGDKQKITIQVIPREAPRITDSTMVEIEIGPKAWFEYSKSDTNSLKASFKNLTLGDTDSWHWDFGDGFTSTEKSPAPHTYKKPGEYIITLTTTDPYGSSTYSRKIFFP